MHINCKQGKKYFILSVIAEEGDNTNFERPIVTVVTVLLLIFGSFLVTRNDKLAES